MSRPRLQAAYLRNLEAGQAFTFEDQGQVFVRVKGGFRPGRGGPVVPLSLYPSATVYLWGYQPADQDMASQPLPQAARVLNAHHAKTLAGFYGRAGLSGRFFKARVKAGVLQVLQVNADLSRQWLDVDMREHSFADHNGHALIL